MISSTDLYALLGQIYRNQSEIRLLNIYKGLPISYDASISSLANSEIHVSSNMYQIACMYHQRETYIQEKQLPYTIRCQVMSLNLAKEDALLANFEMVTNDIGSRMNIRVEPNEPLVGVVQFKGYPNKIIAPIADISIYGASIFIDDFLFPVRLFQIGNEISMAISFPEMTLQKTRKVILTGQSAENRGARTLVRSTPAVGVDGKIEVNAWGKIMAVRPELNENRYRVSIKFYIKDPERVLVSQYISQRQKEIIQDLRILSEELYSRKN